MYHLVDRESGISHQLVPGKSTIGRAESNTIRPDSKSVSKNHAEIVIFEQDNKAPILRDFQSRNGTFIGRGNPLEWQKVKGQVANNLQENDIIRFGNASPIFVFRYESEVEIEEKLAAFNQLDEVQYDADGLPIAAPAIPSGSDGISSPLKNGGDIELESPHLTPSRSNNLPLKTNRDTRSIISIEYPTETHLRLHPSPSSRREDDYNDDTRYDSKLYNSRDVSREIIDENIHPSPNKSSQQQYRASSEQHRRSDERRRDAMHADGYTADETLQLRGSKSRSPGREQVYSQEEEDIPQQQQQLPPQNNHYPSSSSVMRSSPTTRSPARSSTDSRHHRQHIPSNTGMGRYQQQEQKSHRPHPGLRSGYSSNLPGLSGISGSLASEGREPPPPLDQGSAFTMEQTDLDAYMEKTGFGSFLPRSSLTLPERRAVEAHREKLAEEVMRANKALSGAIKYSEWEKDSNAAKRSFAPGTSSQPETKTSSRKFPSTGTDLMAPPEHGRTTKVMDIVSYILGTKPDSPAEEGAFFYDAPSIEPILSEEIVREALAEGLIDMNETVAGRLESVVEELQRIYTKSYTACLIDDFDDMAAIHSQGQDDEIQIPVAVMRAAEALAFSCDIVDEIKKSGLVRALIDADENDRPSESIPTRMGDRINYGQHLLLSAYECIAGQKLEAGLGAINRLERLASHGGSALVTPDSVLQQLVQSEQHAVLANTIYPIILGLRHILRDLEVIVSEIDNVGDFNLLQEEDEEQKKTTANMINQDPNNMDSGHAILRAFNEDMNAEGELRLSRSLSVPVKDADNAPITARIVTALENKRIRTEQLKLAEHTASQLETPAEDIRSRLDAAGVEAAKLGKMPASKMEACINKFRKATLFMANPALRSMLKAWNRWRRVHTNPEEFDPANEVEKIPKPYHDKVIKELKNKVNELSERLHEIAIVSDTDAALIAEKALNRELTTSNIMLREEVHLLRAQILDLSAAHLTPAERTNLLREMLDKAEEFNSANREIRALREQLSRFHGDSPEQAAAALKKGLKTPSVGRWGTLPPKLHELKGNNKLPAPMTPVEEPVVDSNGKPVLRRRRPWTKNQCKMISRDDARRIVLEEVRRLRQSFIDGERERNRLKEQLADESGRCIKLEVSLHALQERYMEREYKLNNMQAILDTQAEMQEKRQR